MCAHVQYVCSKAYIAKMWFVRLFLQTHLFVLLYIMRLYVICARLYVQKCVRGAYRLEITLYANISPSQDVERICIKF